MKALVQMNGGIKKGAQTAFAEKVGVSKNTVSLWSRNLSKPDERLRPKAAALLGLSVDELMDLFKEYSQKEGSRASLGMVREPTAEYMAARITMIPVVGSVSAEKFNCMFDNPPEEYLPVAIEGFGGKRYVALRISGKCMEGTAGDGEYVVVAEADNVQDGRLAVVRINGECTFKRVFYKKDHVLLKPDNQKHKAIEVRTEDLQIVGVVVVFVRKP